MVQPLWEHRSVPPLWEHHVEKIAEPAQTRPLVHWPGPACAAARRQALLVEMYETPDCSLRLCVYCLRLHLAPHPTRLCVLSKKTKFSESNL